MITGIGNLLMHLPSIYLNVFWLQIVLGVIVRYQIIEVYVVLRVVNEDLRDRLASWLSTDFAVRLLLLHRLPALPRLLRA